MRTNPVAVTDDTDQERVGQLFREHGLFVVPVVDHAGRMKGVVTVDDIVAVLDEEATEDMQKTGGVAALDAPYPKATLGSMLRKRGGWLTLLFFGEMLTATAMAWFEEQLARAIVLALFVPLIISSGGNAGSQATTLVIRAMALGEVTSRDWLGVVRREFAVGWPWVSSWLQLEQCGFYCGRNCLDRYGQHYVPHRDHSVAQSRGCGAVGDARRFRTALHPSLFQVGSCQCIGAVCRHTRGRDGLDYLFHCCGRCSKRNVVVICGVH